ncbi:hypothetical protein [Antrihabitans sp. YC2-6]|uniref:hypothetical protein n=1 Tax=Antrihabitans sp. YC2-6 TaxID=2799498 RepID=UPI0018F56D0D|nr:hypothetical protein [Antrihabitans sp. YC2-6]MBJ8346983.1 hypothetical protein [Antrihabitans sp. YC2-6]
MKPTAWTIVYVLTMVTVALVGITLTAAGSGLGNWAAVGGVGALSTAATVAAIAIIASRGHDMPRHS